MKVKELIEQLQRFDENKSVIFEGEEGIVDDMVVNEGLENEVVITPF